jgi:hypothetical protein
MRACVHTGVSSDVATFVPRPPGFPAQSVCYRTFGAVVLTPVSIAFHRWIAAEEDVVDASRLLQSLREGDGAHAAEQQAVVIQLRSDADIFLREYMYVLQCDAYQFLLSELPPPK